MTRWEKLQYASLGLLDLAREWMEQLIAMGRQTRAGEAREHRSEPEHSTEPDEVTPRRGHARRAVRSPARSARTHRSARRRPKAPLTSRTEQKAHILNCLGEGKPLTLGQISGRLNRPPQGFARAVKELVQEERIVRRKDATYVLTTTSRPSKTRSTRKRATPRSPVTSRKAATSRKTTRKKKTAAPAKAAKPKKTATGKKPATARKTRPSKPKAARTDVSGQTKAAGAKKKSAEKS